MADVVGPRDLRQGFASLAPRQGFSLLMLREGRLATKLHASNLRSLPAFGSPRQDQMPLKLGKAPSIPRPKQGFSFGNFQRGDVDFVVRRSTEGRRSPTPTHLGSLLLLS